MKRTISIFLCLLALLPLSAQTSLSLSDCRSMAVQHDPHLRNAHLDVMAARAQKQEAFSEYFPAVSISSFGFWSLDPMLEIGVKDILGENELADKVSDIVNEAAPQLGISPVYSTLKYGYSASIMAMQPLYAGGRIVAGNRLAALGVEAAQLQQDMTVRDRILDVESAYWQVVALQEKMVTLEGLAAMLDTLARDVSVAVDAGVAVDADLMQVQLKRTELKGGQTQLQGSLRLAKMNLFHLIGQEYCMTPALADSLKPFIDDIVFTDRLSDLQAPSFHYVPEEEIVAGLDEARLLDLAVESRSLEKRMALGEALPQVAIGASYGYSRVLNDRFNGTAFAMIQIPISDWGKVSRKMERIGYQMQKAQNDRDYVSSQLLLQIRQLWLSLTVAWDAMQLCGDAVQQARLTAERQGANYAAGLISLSDLLQAQSALQQAEESLLNARIAYSTALSAYQARK
jgi:outer membrane protein TolC